jgi:hypothetical protein
VAFHTLVALWLAPAGTKITSPALNTLGLPAVDRDFERPLQQMATALPAEAAGSNQPSGREGDMDQNSGSWNRLTSWLRKVEALRSAA